MKSLQNIPQSALVGLLEMVHEGWLNNKTGELARGVKIRSTDTVVDVGCGEAGFIDFCARQSAEVIFIDQDKGRLAVTEERIKESPARAYRAIISDCDPIPLADATADVVICMEVLEHVRSPSNFLSELVRIAKPGAQLVITVPDARSEILVGATAPDYYFDEPGHVRIFSSEEFRELLVDAGLQVEREHYMGCFWSMYLALSWLTAEHDGNLPLDNPHPITEHWTKLWSAIQEHPRGGLIRHALNDLIPRTHAIVACKPL